MATTATSAAALVAPGRLQQRQSSLLLKTKRRRVRPCVLSAVLMACGSLLVQLSSATAFSLRSRQSRTPMVQPIFLPISAGSGSSDKHPSPLHASSSSSAAAMPVPINGSAAPITSSDDEGALGPLQSRVVKFGMLSFVASMCVVLPLSLLPNHLLWRLNVISRVQKEKNALHIGQLCCSLLLTLIPFCRVKCIPNHEDDPPPCVWVCNHTSMLDVFLLMAADWKLRGKSKRPIKIVYWKQLEDNPVTKLLFQECGFIPVQMAANKPGEANDYDRASFRTLLQESKRAFDEGFDIGILPEGQLNPTPEKGLLPAFPGAFTLAKLSRRPIHMMALHGVQRLWHPHEDIGMTPSHNTVHIRCYPNGKVYQGPDEFVKTFTEVVGYFGQHGRDLPNLEEWLDGSAWDRELQSQEQQQEQET